MSHAVKPDAPVLIVGSGPVGLFQAYMLAKLGVPVILAERHTARLGAPKAHALSPRSLEICRQFGVSVSEIRQKPAPRDEAKWVRFVTNLSGEEVGCLPYERMSVDVLDATPEMLHNIAQPDFEGMLSDLLSQEANAEILRGWTWMSCEETEMDGSRAVISTLQNTYNGEKRSVLSRFVIACDGANSKVRQALGITVDSEDTPETMMTIHFNANLRPVVKERLGMLHWIMDPAARGFIIAYDLGGNQVLIHNFDPVHHSLDSFDREKCRRIVLRAIGQDVPVDIHSSLPWILRRQIANSFHVGAVILAGDAAHSFPPTGGLGLNSGIADAHNLAYKIRDIYRVDADAATLFDMYEQERRPVAMRNALQSVKNGRKIFSLLRALKNTDADIDYATRSMNEALRDPEQRAVIANLIEDQREHFDNLNLHIGYVYEADWNPVNASQYVPAYRPGARLPHVWINGPVVAADCPKVDLSYLEGELSPTVRDERKYSTLDLVHREAITIICGDAHITPAEELVRSLKARRVVSRVASHPRDFVFSAEEAGAAWLRGLNIAAGNLVIVRPDQHIQISIKPGTGVSDAVFEILKGVGITT